MRRFLICVLLVMTADAIAWSQAGMTKFPLARNTAGRRIPATYFGMNLAGATWKHPWPTVDVGAVRVFDAGWARLEPSKGKWDFQHLDKDVADSVAHHADIDLILTSTPTWASARPGEQNPYVFQPSGSRAEARDVADWENYVRTVSKRYKGRVYVYELWNEPNMSNSYSGDVSSLIRMCKAAYKALKETDPAITVISPSPAPEGGIIYLRKFIEQGGGSTFDIAGFHFYDNLNAPSARPDKIVPAALQLRKMLSSLSLSDRPIWNTESGYYIQSSSRAASKPHNFPLNAHVLSQKEAVDALVRSYIIAWTVGIERFYWYAWGEPLFAFVDDNGTTAKNVTASYATVRKWLLGKIVDSVDQNDEGIWIVTLHSDGGRPEHILWKTGAAQRFSIPKEWNAKRTEDPAGREVDLSAQSQELTETPVFIR